MRKLAWAGLSFSAAVFMTHYLLPEVLRLPVMLTLLVLGTVGAVGTKGKLRVGILLVCVFAAFGILRYDVQVRTKLQPAALLAGRTEIITGIVTEYPEDRGNYSRVVVYRTDHDRITGKALLYVYEELPNIRPGDIVRGEVSFVPANISGDEETDTYIADGIYIRGYATSTLYFMEQWWGRWIFAPLYFGNWIRETISEYVPENGAAFLHALLTGDKAELYGQTENYHILQRAGIAHIVAVSGMHVSFLIGMVLTFAGNRRGWLFSIIFVVLFAFMTGLSPSVLRAVFMQLLFLMAPVVRRESDGVTSLTFALFLLLIHEPFAAASVSLQLSFASMAGIILLAPRMLEWFKWKGKDLTGRMRSAYLFVVTSLATSFGATALTAPLCALYFGYISLLAPLTNLLVLWLIPYCFGGGFLICGAACVSGKLALLLGTILGWFIDLIYLIAGAISHLPLAAVYLPNILLILCFLVCYGSFGLFWLLKEERYRPVLPTCISLVTLFAMMTGVMFYYRMGTFVGAIDVGQGQSIVLLDGKTTVMVDCGGEFDSGQRAANWLYQHGRQNVDLLVLTHYDEDHINGVTELMVQIPVTQILCSDLSLDNEERADLREIIFRAEETGTDVTMIRKTGQLHIDDVHLIAYQFEKSGRNDGIMALLQVGSFDMLVTGDADVQQELYLLFNDRVPDGECIVVGHHGAKTSTGDQLLEQFSPEFAFVSSGHNPYGHPTQEVLDRLAERNVVIYRTDQLGSIEVKVR